jgi:hypothetical protein
VPPFSKKYYPMQIQVHNLGHLPTAPLDDFHKLQEEGFA